MKPFARILLGLGLATVVLAGPDEDAKKKPTLVDIVRDMRIRKHETAAIATLRNITSAQAQFQATGSVDVDNDGVGEYGAFAELSGAVTLRGTNRTMNPPVLSTAFRKVKNGVVTRSGYHFRVFLMGKKGPVGESATGGFDAATLDPKFTETTWCVYAWPEKFGETGRRTFFVSHWGDILFAAKATYTGAQGPAALAAFLPKQKTLGGKLAMGVAGQDANVWKVMR